MLDGTRGWALTTASSPATAGRVTSPSTSPPAPRARPSSPRRMSPRSRRTRRAPWVARPHDGRRRGARLPARRDAAVRHTGIATGLPPYGVAFVRSARDDAARRLPRCDVCFVGSHHALCHGFQASSSHRDGARLPGPASPQRFLAVCGRPPQGLSTAAPALCVPSYVDCSDANGSARTLRCARFGQEETREVRDEAFDEASGGRLHPGGADDRGGDPRHPLAAVAIPAFTRYVKRSKTSEAAGNIAKIYQGELTYYQGAL